MYLVRVTGVDAVFCPAVLTSETLFSTDGQVNMVYRSVWSRFST